MKLFNSLTKKILLLLGVVFVLPSLAFAYFAYSGNADGQVLGAQSPLQYPVQITDNGVDKFYYSDQTESDAILKDLQIKTYPEDKIKALGSPEIGYKVIIRRATPVTIDNGGKVIALRTWQETVGQLLAEQKINIGELDILEPAKDTALTRDAKIKVTYVREEETTETESITFETTKKEDPNLLKGKTKIEQEGKAGKNELKYKLRYENDQLIKKDLVGKTQIEKPRNKIVVYGTGLPLVGQGMASWFSTSAGVCAHRTLPFGTRLRITNVANGRQATCTVRDRGPFNSRIIDLSTDVFSQLASLGSGVILVRVEKVM